MIDLNNRYVRDKKLIAVAEVIKEDGSIERLAEDYGRNIRDCLGKVIEWRKEYDGKLKKCQIEYYDSNGELTGSTTVMNYTETRKRKSRKK